MYNHSCDLMSNASLPSALWLRNCGEDMEGCFTAIGEWRRTVTKYQGCAWISKNQIEKCKTKRKWIG